jgi:hypothetical protein
MEINGVNIKGLLRSETIALIKTGIAILAALWFVAEPYVEDYVHEQVNIVQKADRLLIDSLEVKINNLQTIIDEDYHKAKERSNEIVKEIQYFYPQTRLQLEK